MKRGPKKYLIKSCPVYLMVIVSFEIPPIIFSYTEVICIMSLSQHTEHERVNIFSLWAAKSYIMNLFLSTNLAVCPLFIKLFGCREKL